MGEEEPFKICPGCFAVWSSREEFLADPSLRLNGYKADLKELEFGLFFFTHQKEPCFSTMALEVQCFRDLFTGTVYSERRTGMEDCPRYCKDQRQLERCNALYECAFAREIVHIIRSRHGES